MKIFFVQFFCVFLPPLLNKSILISIHWNSKIKWNRKTFTLSLFKRNIEKNQYLSKNCFSIIYLFSSPNNIKQLNTKFWFTLVQFSCSVVSNSLWPHGLPHSRLRCPSPTPRACSNSCPLSRWYHPTISSSVTAFSSCLLSVLAPGSFPVSQFFASGGQILESQLQYQSFQWIFRTDFL